MAIFVVTLLFSIFYTEQIHTGVASAFTLAFVLIFISSFLPRKETKVTSLVTQTGALELLDLSPLPIFTYEKKDDDIVIRFANKACHTALSRGNKSLLQQSINQLTMLEDAEELLSICIDTLRNAEMGTNRIFFIRGKTANNSTAKFMCSTSKIKWLEQKIGICFLFDISDSENQHVEMLHHVNEGYKTALIAGIVHDFRNVLNSIIGTAEVLQFDIKDEKAKRQLDVIIDAGERGANTITDLLQVSSGTQNEENKSEPRDIQPDLKSICSLLRVQLPNNIKLINKIEPNLPHVKVGTTPLEQILMNLVNNASQAIDKENGVITVHASSIKLNSHDILRITVSDNGCGISEKDLPYITDNFWTKRKSSGGTGLGMAMVKRVVTQHGGRLEISSQVGSGTQMTIDFPCNNETLETSTPSSKDEPHQKEPIKNIVTQNFKAKPCTILMIDDQSSVLHVQQMLLEAMGHKVIGLSNGNDAINVFSQQKKEIQMVITDFKMPDIDGIELSLKLREINPNIPLLMVTGYAEQEKLQQAQDLNMTIIQKPTNLKKFSEAVAETQLKYPNIFS